MRIKPAIVEKRLLASLTPDGDGVDEDVMLHPKMLVETDFLVLLRKAERLRRANAAVKVARRVAQDVSESDSKRPALAVRKACSTDFSLSLASFLPNFLPSFLPSFLPNFLPSYLSSFGAKRF